MELEEATRDGLTVDLRRIDAIVRDGVNLRCINSSDFVVGKQTNFNGPVTIINCAKDGLGVECVAAGPRAEAAKPEASPCTEGACKRKFLNVPALLWLLVLFLFVAGCVTLLVELPVNHDDAAAEDAEVLEGNGNHTLFARRHWRAEPEKSSVRMRLPVRYVIVRSTGERSCSGLRDCGHLLREIQTKERARTRSDIYANFLVGSDGSVYEGRGWAKRNAFRGFANSRSLDVCFVGRFDDEEPTESQMDAARALVARGVVIGVVATKHSVVAGNETNLMLPDGVATVGHKLYAAIETWPEFESRPYQNLYGSGLV